MSLYRTSSRAYLARARALRGNGNTESLLYSALEVRCGIEARLHEYLEGAARVATVKKGHWQIRHLGREVEKVFDTYTKAVVATFQHPDTKEKIRLEYTPVTPRLKKIGEMLGDFLHYTPEHKLASVEFLERFAAVVDEGMSGLTFATRGTLLGPPGGSGPANTQIRFMFEAGCMPSFLKAGVEARFRMRFIIVGKDHEKAYVKPA